MLQTHQADLMSTRAQKEPLLTRLLVRDINGESITFPLDKDHIVLGRSITCELSYPKNDWLARFHARISRTGAVWQVEDLGSLNGTSLNGKTVSRPTRLRVGDRVVAGQGCNRGPRKKYNACTCEGSPHRIHNAS
jgi:pSer/pThr/pTyr-binding forkhead associated (FHA) protein